MHDQCTSLGKKNYAISPQQTTQTCKIILIKAVSFLFPLQIKDRTYIPCWDHEENMPINTVLHLLTLIVH